MIFTGTNKKRTVLLGFGASVAATLALRALTLPLMSWLVEPSILAQFALWQIPIRIGVLIAGQGLGHALLREYHELDSVDRPLLLAHLLLIALGAGGSLAIAIAAGSSLWFQDLANSAGQLPITIWILLPTHLVLQWGASYLRLQQAARAFAFTQVGGRLLWLSLLVGAWWITSGSGLARSQQLLLLWTGAELLNAAWLAWLLKSELALAWQGRHACFSALWRKRLYSMLRYARPLLLSECLYWAMGALGAALLTSWHGLDSMAVYAMSVAIGGASSMAGQLFNTVWLPEVYHRHHENKDLPWLPQKASQFVWLWLLIVLLGSLGSTTLWWLLPTHYKLVPYLAAASLLKPALMALQRVTAIGIELRRTTWISPLAMLCGLAVQVASAWWLIPIFASAGAVISSLLGAAVFWQLKSLASAHLWRSVGGWRLYLPVWLAVAVSSFLAIYGFLE